MRGFDGERLQSLAKTVSLFGKEVAISKTQQYLMPHILEVFTEHDAEELKRMIQANYPLAEQETPAGIRQALDNLGSNPELRSQWEGTVVNLVTPENILHWLRHPEEWLDAEEAEAQRAELKRCAEVIEESAGGEEWLEQQVLQLYRFANIISSDQPTTDQPAAEVGD